MAANRSIKYLTIEGIITFGLEMRDTVGILGPFIQNNLNLCYLELSHFTSDTRTAQILAYYLSHGAKSLKEFRLKRCDGITGRALEKIMTALKANPNITTLSLDENQIDDDVAGVLGGALKTLGSLKSLTLNDYEYDGLHYASISQVGMAAIAGGLSQNSTLEKLSFRHNHIGVDGGFSLAEAISNNPALKIKELDLTYAMSPPYAEMILSHHGWAMFFGLLSNCNLESLSLEGSTISDDDCSALAESINSMALLRKLNITNCSRVTSSGWATFYGSLKNNTSLHECNTRHVSEWLFGNANANWNMVEDEVIANTICDRTSIESICKSNHTLFLINTTEDSYFNNSHSLSRTKKGLSSTTRSLVKMNTSENKVEVVRQKIIKYYFIEDNNLHELAHMELGLLPRVLEHVGKYEPGRLFEVLRAIPSLVHNVDMSTETNRKRSRTG